MEKIQNRFEDAAHAVDSDPLAEIKESLQVMAENFNAHAEYWDFGERMRVFSSGNDLVLKLKDKNNGHAEILSMSITTDPRGFFVQADAAVENSRIEKVSTHGRIESLRQHYLNILAIYTGDLDGEFQYELHPADKLIEAKRQKNTNTISAPALQ